MPDQLDIAQIIFALQRAERRLQSEAEALGAALDYGAEFPAEDAERMREAVALLQARQPSAPGHATRGLQELRTVLSIDSPETRGWAPLVQQAARRAIDCALHALRERESVPVSVSRGDALRDVAAERSRQVEAEGWTPEHDDEHNDGSMAAAAACYAMHSAISAGIDSGRVERLADPVQAFDRFVPSYWPWAREWWKPRDKRRNLVKAAALLLAEIERLDRAARLTDGHERPEPAAGEA